MGQGALGDSDALAAINILVCGLHALWGWPTPEPFRLSCKGLAA